MLKVKICGITNYDDAAMAVSLGADALGFIFAPASPRQIEPATAADIIRRLPPFIKSVGVFVNEDIKKIRDVSDYCGLDIIQLHGDETPEMCESLMPRTIKAIRVKDDTDISQLQVYRGKTRALLLDTYSEKAAGGTGKRFNWDRAVEIKRLDIPVILAGGLTPSNIEEAIKKVRPYVVDINSGIEKSPGIKDHELMKELFQNIGKEKIENRKRNIGKSKEMYGPIKHFTDIEAWKLAKELRVELYKIARLLPPDEKYNLTSQMMRSAVSCTANIAEGYGRFHYQENIQFCRISRGSMYEAQDHLITCLDNNYINKEEYEKTNNISTNAIKVIDGYIRYLKNKSKEQEKQ